MDRHELRDGRTLEAPAVETFPEPLDEGVLGEQPTAELADSAGTATGARSVSFAGKLGSQEVLPARGVSESVVLVLKLRPGAGFDTALDFRVKGRVSR